MAARAATGETVSAALPSPWSPQQRRWLQALGHRVIHAGGVVAEAEPVPDPVPAPVVAVPVAHPGPVESPRPVAAPSPSPSPSPRAPAHAVDVPIVAAPPPGPAARTGSTRRTVQMPGRLQLALLRASGLDPADPATMEAMAQWPIEQLRADAAAKRAFWPQLRALRKPSR